MGLGIACLTAVLLSQPAEPRCQTKPAPHFAQMSPGYKGSFEEVISAAREAVPLLS